MNPISREPVLIQALATIVVWAATRYGLQISDEQALQVAGGAFVVLAPFVRQLVRPVAKDETPLTAEEMAHARALLAVKETAAKVEQVVEPRPPRAYKPRAEADKLPPPQTGVKPPDPPS